MNKQDQGSFPFYLCYNEAFITFWATNRFTSSSENPNSLRTRSLSLPDSKNSSPPSSPPSPPSTSRAGCRNNRGAGGGMPVSESSTTGVTHESVSSKMRDH